MPELPEVETIVRGLKRTILNKTIDLIYLNSPKINKGNFEGWLDILHGKSFRDVNRRGKNILIESSSGYTLWVHLKMTGHLYYVPKNNAIDKHDLMVFYLQNDDYSLRFNDYRRFGNIRLLKSDESRQQKGLATLGPEPLEISRNDFIKLFQTTKRMIKPALLDQTFLAGLGNIYADESLFLAGIHPRRLTNTISEKKLIELYGIIQNILKKAISKMGTSVDSFAGVDGKPGGYQTYLKAYGREGEPCWRCGAKIKREKIGSRSAHYCPRCQKLR
jgi:formamidopyrimidine-DNA glycosylase